MAFIPCSPAQCVSTRPTPKIVTQYPQNLRHIKTSYLLRIHITAPSPHWFFGIRLPWPFCVHFSTSIRWTVILYCTFYCNGVFCHRTGEYISWLEYKQGKFDKSIILIHIDIHVILDKYIIWSKHASFENNIQSHIRMLYIGSTLLVYGMYLHMDSNLQDKLLLKENNGNGEMRTTYWRSSLLLQNKQQLKVLRQ